MARFRSTFFCYRKEPQKLHGLYGIENGNVVPFGFEVGDRIMLCLGGPTHPVQEMTLTAETFAEERVVLPDGTVADTETIWNVYRLDIEGDESDEQGA